jgi:Ca2+-binding RTX toxin-like protein
MEQSIKEKTATDNHGERATNTFDLEVVNINDTPLEINLSNSSINENSSNGTIIGNLSTLDPDVGDTHSYTLINNADGRFTLDGNKLLVAQGNRLDFEAIKNHLIEIKTTDAVGLSFTTNLTISLKDLNEAPITINDQVTANSSKAKIISIESLLSNDRDPEGNPLSLVSVDNATNGKVSLDNNNIIFTPNGTSSKGNFEYSVSDGVLTSTAAVTVDVGITEIGSKLNDSLIGTPGDDSIQGNSGNDTLNGSNGDDTLDGAKDNDLLLGGESVDYLIGGRGTDTLDGAKDNDYLSGGSGNDILTGGKGKDSFVFNSSNQGVDTITDFSVKDDTLVFSAAGFGGNLVAGKVSSQMFTLGNAATSSSHRFIYNVGSGDLFYDSDGIGGNEQIRIAQLDSGLSLGSDDLLVG